MQSKEQPLVTVTIPVYNGEPFLRECLDSVLAQTYQNWRLVIVDNASTDGSGEISEEYARRDARVRVIHNESLIPALENHNRMLTFLDAEAKYCKPLMADDWLYPDCLEKMVAAAEAEPTVGLVSSLSFNGKNIWGFGIQFPAPRIPGKRACHAAIGEELYGFFGSPSEMLIRADIVRRHQPFYTLDHPHTDYESAFLILQESDFALVYQLLSYSRNHEGQLSTKAKWLDCWQLSVLNVLLRYGRGFLTEREYDAQLDRAWMKYYRILAKAVLMRKGKSFWEYHDAWLGKKQLRISRLRLAWVVTVEGARWTVYRAFRSFLWPFVSR